MSTLSSQDPTSVLTLQLPRSRHISYASLFENNDYLRMLNRLLLCELGAIDLYLRCAERLLLPEEDRERILRNHQQQAKNLVNLIVYNRGIPDKRGFSITPELSILASDFGRRFGRSWAYRSSRASCLHLERILGKRYAAAMRDAPYTDRCLLSDHARQTQRHQEWLSHPVESDDA